MSKFCKQHNFRFVEFLENIIINYNIGHIDIRFDTGRSIMQKLPETFALIESVKNCILISQESYTRDTLRYVAECMHSSNNCYVIKRHCFNSDQNSIIDDISKQKNFLDKIHLEEKLIINKYYHKIGYDILVKKSIIKRKERRRIIRKL